jgi:tetraacyldisaccharide 4'-kinase
LGGNGFFLPSGPLRESLSRARDATLLNDPENEVVPSWPHTFSLTFSVGEAWNLCQPTLQRPLTRFAKEHVFAMAGIGVPERFFTLLRKEGLRPAVLALPDHFNYAHDLFAEVSADAILVTEKDAVKCADVWQDARLWAVPVKAQLDPALIELIVEKIRGDSPT